jgi:hypothetical protein
MKALPDGDEAEEEGLSKNIKPNKARILCLDSIAIYIYTIY